MAKKSLTDMAIDAAEAWAEQNKQRDGRTTPANEKLAFAVGYTKGFKSGQTAKPVGGRG